MVGNMEGSALGWVESTNVGLNETEGVNEGLLLGAALVDGDPVGPDEG